MGSPADDMVHGLEDLAEKLAAGEDIDAIRVQRVDTPDGPMYLRTKIIITTESAMKSDEPVLHRLCDLLKVGEVVTVEYVDTNGTVPIVAVWDDPNDGSGWGLRGPHSREMLRAYQDVLLDARWRLAPDKARNQ